MGETLLKTESKIKTKKPKLYSVIIHNDDVTPMDFVVIILNKIFDKSVEEADKLMLEAHNRGSVIAGIYVFEIANTKKSQADVISIEHGYPLKLTLEEYID